MAKDYYRTLGVEKSATNQEIKRAYRKLAKQFHPDVNKEASADRRFKDIQEAFDVLGDEEKRTQYDRYGSDYERMAGAVRGNQQTTKTSSVNTMDDSLDRPVAVNPLVLKTCSVHFLIKKKNRRMKNWN